MVWRRLGLTDEELEEEKIHEMEKVMQREKETREERERLAAEEALLKARRQEEWVRHSWSHATTVLSASHCYMSQWRHESSELW